MNSTKISIVIPTYNRAWCIENAIKSILSQNYDNWELFIIDDGSTDNTKEVIDKYLLNDKIKYYFDKNKGKTFCVNYSINNLISKDSDLLFILDSDDEFLPGILEDVVDNFVKNSDYVSYHYKARFPDNIKNRKSELVKNELSDVLVDYNTFVSGKSHTGDFPGFINIHKLLNIRFEEKCPNGLEGIFWLRLSRNGLLKFINKFGLFVDSSRKENQKKDNLTSYSNLFERAKTMITGYDILIEENQKDVLNYDKIILSKWYFEQFQWCIIDRQLKKGLDSWLMSLIYGNTKSKIKVFIFGFLFLIPKSLLPIILKMYYKNK